MEITKTSRLHPFRDLSLKWSFALYVAVCILAALCLSFSLSGFFSALQNNIQKYYDDLYREEFAKRAYLVSDGEILQGEGIWLYTEDLRTKFSAKDARLYDIYGVLTVLIVPVVSVLCLLTGGVLFYLRKLKKPLLILASASAQIAAGDLDFQVKYHSRNEFGRLISSFEIMRTSLLENNREMWRLMEERKRLNAAFSHDLRTPLTVLRGYCDFLAAYLPTGKISNEKAGSILTTIDRYLKRLEGYNATMSSLQKLEEIQLFPEEIPFTSLCADLNNISALLQSDKKITFCPDVSTSFDTSTSFDASTSFDTSTSFDACISFDASISLDTSISLDLAAVTQVYENLVANAVRYAKDQIQVSCFRKGDFLYITVTDDGPGFTKEALTKAMEPYYRDEKEDPHLQHFGIGLYLCRLLCEKHGGTLVIENADSGGRVTARFRTRP